MFSSGRWSELGRAFGKQVATSPVFWLSLFLSAALAWKRRALIASIQGTSAQVGKPASDRLAYSLHALILSLVTAAPLPLFLGATGWHLQAAAQGTELSHAVGLTLTHTAWVLWGILALRAICLPSGTAMRSHSAGLRRPTVRLPPRACRTTFGLVFRRAPAR